MAKKLSKVEKAQMRLKGILTISDEKKQEFYNTVKEELPLLEEKLNKWNPRTLDKKRIKGELEQTMESLKKTGGKCYSKDLMMFGFLKSWL